MRVARAVVLVASLALVGCGSSKHEAEKPPTTPRATTAAATTTGATRTEHATTTVAAPARERLLDVYFLRDGKLAAVGRPLGSSAAAASAAVTALFAGPTQAERAAGFTTAIPSNLRLTGLSIKNGVAIADFDPMVNPTTPEFAQIVWTLTQFPTVKSVSIVLETQDAAAFRRSDVEQYAAPIILDSPTPNERVSLPLHLSGTANAYEATVNYDVRDASGKSLKSGYFTASSGSGHRGTFDETLDVDVPAGTTKLDLMLFEISAANGKRTHVVHVPLQVR